MKPSPTPYAQALLDYWQGDMDAAYTIHRDDDWSQVVSVAPAYGKPPFGPVEELALEKATGHVLDVGAGVGRHALALQERGSPVAALEIVPELAGIMAKRGVIEPLAESLFSLVGKKFDTVLMLMNGFGLVGTPVGADTFFKHVRQLLQSGGQILCDSLDVRGTSNPEHLAYQEANIRQQHPPGQMRFRIEYQGRSGEFFDWLHLDFEALRDHASRHGWFAERLLQEENGHYLARLIDADSRAV